MSEAAVRIDRWLWAVRVFKTRAASQTACSKGRVKVGDDDAKPARRVRVGDRITVRLTEHIRILEVVKPLEKRVGAALASEAFIDHSPPAPERPAAPPPIPGGHRDRGAGRPTKRERRDLDRLRGKR